MSEEKKAKCPCEGATLTRFIQPVILSILAKDSMTGYQLIKKMEDYSIYKDERPDQAGVYRYIRLMKKRGYLTEEETKEGNAQNLMITPAGHQCLTKWRQTLKEYQSEIKLLLKEL